MESWKPIDLEQVRKTIYWSVLGIVAFMMCVDVISQYFDAVRYVPQIIWNIGTIIAVIVAVIWTKISGKFALQAFLVLLLTEINILATITKVDLEAILDLMFILGLVLAHGILVGRFALWFASLSGLAGITLFHETETLRQYGYIPNLVFFVIGITFIVSEFTRVLDRMAERSQKQWEEIQASRERIQREERLDLINHLILGLAHNVGTPLGNARTAISHLKEIPELQDISVLDTMQTNLDEVIDVVNELRKLSILDTGEELGEVTLNRLVEIARQGLEVKHPGLRFHDIKLIGGEVSIRTNPMLLLQVLTVLMDNSLLYGADSKGHIRLDIVLTLVVNGHLIRYRDEGSGIDPGHVPQLFKPYGSMGTSGEGRGMGLTIGRQIAQYQLKGDLIFEEAKNAFLIKLPEQID